jgi:hypothetical protein
MGDIHNTRVQGIYCNLVVHGYKATTKYQEILDEIEFGFSLLFSSMCFNNTKDLATRAIYATITIKSNQMDISIALKDKTAFNRMSKGTLDRRMYESRIMSSIL